MSHNTFHLLPKSPGIYLFKNKKNEIIYVGKAKNLYKRVQSYFREQDDWKIKELIAEYATIEHIATHNEAEALLLEAQLIRDSQPKYNTLLKNGNPFIYLLFTDAKDGIGQVMLTRSKKETGTYFGPFMHKQSARKVYEYLIRTFKLLHCNKKLDNGCLDYHLGRCAGTCLAAFDKTSYKERLKLAEQALKGDQEEFIQTLSALIQEASKQLAFEKAAHLADYLRNFEQIFQTIKTKYSTAKYLPEITESILPYRRTKADKEIACEHLARFLAMEKITTIDCFDISHFQSKYIVGSCVRFTNGVADKNKFRRFKIRSLIEQNDYAALQEIITRRYKKGDYPDLIIIDGGKGQLSAAQQAVPHPHLISLAKREETIYSEKYPEGIKLDIKQPEAQLLIELRDYAHHFAIGYHQHLFRKSYAQQADKIVDPYSSDHHA